MQKCLKKYFHQLIRCWLVKIYNKYCEVPNFRNPKTSEKSDLHLSNFLKVVKSGTFKISYTFQRPNKKVTVSIPKSDGSLQILKDRQNS